MNPIVCNLYSPFVIIVPMSNDQGGLYKVMGRREVLKGFLAAGAVAIGGLGATAVAGANAEARGDRRLSDAADSLATKQPGARPRFRGEADRIAFRDGHMLGGNEMAAFNHDLPYRNREGIVVYPNPVGGPARLRAGMHHEDLHHTYSPELLRELDTPFMIADPLETVEGMSKQRINAIIANRTGNMVITNMDGIETFQVIDPEKPVLINMEYFGNKANVRETNYRIGEKARQNADSLVITFDAPNQGSSDSLTERQLTDLRDGNGDMDEIGATYLRIIKSMGIRVIDVEGSSMGSRLALSVSSQAADYDIRVRKVILNDAPGVDQHDISLAELFGRNAADFASLSLMHSNPLDELMFEASGMDRSNLEQTLEKLWVGATLLDDDPWLLYSRALRKATVEKSVRNILQTQPDASVTFVNGGASHLSPKDQLHRVVKKLKHELDPDGTRPNQRQRVGTIIKPGVSHFAEAQPQFIGARTRYIREIPLIESA